MDIIDRLWNAGIPLGLLAIGIVVVWLQWRDDMKTGSKQRDDMVSAINDLSALIRKVLKIDQ